MSQTYSPSPKPTRRVYLLLTIVWAILTLAALAFVVVFGANAPYADEWEFVPALLGKESLTTWLWTQHNEHRLPLSRLIYCTLFRLTHDFRAGMFLQVALLSGLSLWLMRLAARFRGRSEWVDAFFPVSLLHLGHWENFIMGYQLCFVLFCCLVTCLAVIAIQTQRETAFRSGLFAGVLLLLIALTGGFGLPVVPPVAVWLGYLSVILRREGKRLQASILLVLAVLPLLYMAIYFNGYEKPSLHPPPSRDPFAVGMVAGEVLAMALGIGVAGIWWLVALVEVVIGLGTVELLIKLARTANNWPSSAGLVAYASGVCGLAVAIGIGRGSMGTDMGLWPRYSLLVWPLLGTAFLVWVKAGRRLIPIVLCASGALAFPSNMVTGMQAGMMSRTHYDQIESDVKTGVPTDQIVGTRFPNSFNAGQMDRAIQNVPLLRSAGIGVFGASKR